MKKFLFFVCLAVAMVGCEKEQQEGGVKTEIEENDTIFYALSAKNQRAFSTCDLFDSIKRLSVIDQVKALRLHQNRICNDVSLVKCVSNLHLIGNTTLYNTAKTDYWGTNTVVETTFKLSDFTNESCNYQDFFRFDTDENDTIRVDKIKHFSTTNSCYSITFFKSLKANYSLQDSTKLVFTLGIINNRKAVMLKIDGVNDVYFDYSHFPTGRGLHEYFTKENNYISGKTPF
jgi:hypothetical protein